MSTKLSALRAAHPTFTYLDFTITLEENTLICTYHYQIDNLITFSHRVTFGDAVSTAYQTNQNFIHQLAFHLGLVEMLSYWKLTCSPIIKIAAGNLPAAALPFWQKLLRRGMSEYFYVNQIGFSDENFVTFEIQNDASPPPFSYTRSNTAASLVCFAGGKDSITTARLLEKNHVPFSAFILEPASPAATFTAQDFDQNEHLLFVARRHLDPQLLALNKKLDTAGAPIFYNGHVPFSASLSFVGNLAQVLYGATALIVSNEQSACENSTVWGQQPINHQYSKSLEYEKDFREYCAQLLSENLNYYSLMRPFYEIKIAQLFSSIATKKDLLTFRSCNRGQQQNIWCEQCSKCLFVFLILFAFAHDDNVVSASSLTTKLLEQHIFSHNLFDDDALAGELYKLAGLTDSKPLECVGTIEEVRVACFLVIQKYEKLNRPLPKMLQEIKLKIIDQETGWQHRADNLLQFYGDNFIPATLQKTLFTN